MDKNNVTKTRDALVQDVDKLKRNAVQIAQDVRDHASAHVDETRQRVNETIESVQQNLATHPFTLLGIGFGLGLLLGIRLRR